MLDDIVYHGEGRYSWIDLYNYPIWLRKYTYKKLIERLTPEPEKLPIKDTNKTHTVQKRVFNPSYNTKVSKN